MIILQLSDLHATAPGARVWGKIDSLAAIERAVEQALTLQPPPDLVLLTGDIANDGRDAHYPAVRALLDRLPFPKYLIPGNHDNRAGLRAHFGDWPGLDGAETAPIQTIIDRPGLRIIMLDSTIPGQAAGVIDQAACDFLASALAGAPDTPTLVVQHHPPIPLGLHFMDAMRAEPDPRYFALLAENKQIMAVLCGHYHRYVTTRIGQTPLIVAPALIASIRLDLSGHGPTATIDEPAGCLVHKIDNGQLITHHWPIGDFGAPTYFA